MTGGGAATDSDPKSDWRDSGSVTGGGGETGRRPCIIGFSPVFRLYAEKGRKMFCRRRSGGAIKGRRESEGGSRGAAAAGGERANGDNINRGTD